MHKPKSLLWVLLLVNLFVAQLRAEDPMTFFIGTYTSGSAEGIYRSELDAENGRMSNPTLVATMTNPSFLCLHPTLAVVYAVSEVAEGEQQISAFSISDGKLELLSSHSTTGSGPCYVSTDQTGRYVLVANYGSGSVCSFSTTKSGALNKIVSRQQHTGSSIHPNRQQGPHAHCITVDPSNRFVCVVDLGLDQVIVYRLTQDGQLKNHSVFACTPGHGPRHIAFHPDGKHAFVIHELTCQISCCSWDQTSGELKEIHQVSTLPEDLKAGFSTAEILVHPNGKFVYGSNRGHDTIAVFEFSDSKLTRIQNISTQGKTPRNFRIDPTGRFLLAENQNSDSIHSFSLDAVTGKLTPTGESIKIGSPVCIKFAR